MIELKDPRNETVNYVNTLPRSKLAQWSTQKAKELRVAKECGYQLIGITNNQYLAVYLNDLWKRNPPFFYVQTPAQVKKFASNSQSRLIIALQTSKELSQLVAAKPQEPEQFR